MSDENLKFVGALYLGRLPGPLRDFVALHVDDEVWGALETGTSREEGTLWFVATRTQNALVAVSDGGRFWEHLATTATTDVTTKLTRQVFVADGRELFAALRIGSGRLQRLFELAFLPRPEGLLAAANDHIEAGQWQGAEELLLLAEQTLSAGDRTQQVAYLNVDQKILLAQAHVAMKLGREGDAVVMLAAVSDDRPGDDLLRATEAAHGLPGWLVTLAVAHEEAGQPASAARVYARIYEDEPEEFLLLSRARALRRAGQPEAAVAAFDEFLEHQATTEIQLAADGGANDVAAACLESAELLEQLDRPAEAAERYLMAIRQAPFEAHAYQRLFALRDVVDDAWSLTLAAEILRTLNPAAAAEIDALPPPRERVELPYAFNPIDDEAHAAKIVHPGERGSATLVQKWVGSLTRDERDTRDIERHAQRGDTPQLQALLESAASLAGTEVPRLYLSHGSAGVEVLGADDPFLMLGACHLAEDDHRYLPERELAFTLASQVEHIRAEHVLLTSSEFWRTFGTKSATAVLAFVPLGDVVGRFTDGALLKWVKKLGGTSSGPIRSALELVEKRLADGVTGESVQSAYTASLAKLRSSGLEAPDEASLVKERLANFARAAQYTADRVGLLVADDVNASVHAMVRLSPTLVQHIDVLESGGFARLMEVAADEPALEELVLRVTELLKFALSDDYAGLRAATTA